MVDILAGLAKITFLIFRPLFKLIAWIFSSIFKGIGKAIGGLIVKKGKEVTPKVVTAAGIGAVAAGASVIAEEIETNKQVLKFSKDNDQNKTLKNKNAATSQAVVNSQGIKTYKDITEDRMNAQQMKTLLESRDDIFIEDALRYWKALENADSQDFAGIRETLWS